MSSDVKRTLIALGSFTPVGGGGGEIPADLCVCNLTARECVKAKRGDFGCVDVDTLRVDDALFQTASVGSDIFVDGGMYSPVGSFIDLYSTRGHFQSVYVEGPLYFPAGTRFTEGGLLPLSYDENKSGLTFNGELIETTSPIFDLPVVLPAGTPFCLKNGKKYQIRTDCTTSYPCFNFGGVSIDNDSTAEIWFKVGSRQPEDITLPSDWTWIGTELPDCLAKHSHYAIAVRKVSSYDGVDGHDVTVANLAYEYTAPAGS